MKDKEMKRNTVSVMRITIKVVMILAFLAIWASVAAGMTDGFDDKRGEVSAVSTVSKVDLSAPIRFSQASFMQIERERADHGKSSILNAASKKEVSDKLDFDVRAQLKAASEIVK